jgi:hypothetical protein
MLQQKIVIKLQMSSEKCRIKAMKIAATADGILPIKLNIYREREREREREFSIELGA